MPSGHLIIPVFAIMLVADDWLEARGEVRGPVTPEQRANRPTLVSRPRSQPLPLFEPVVTRVSRKGAPNGGVVLSCSK